MSAVLIPTASEAEWLEARRRGVTASEIAVLMGLSPYDSPYGLYHRKLGNLPGIEQDEAMELGDYLEGFTAGKFARLYPHLIVDGDGRDLWAHPDRPWQMATPDRLLFTDQTPPGAGPGLTLGSAGVLECKIDGGSDEWGVPGTDEIPVHYRAQVLWQCDVMGMHSWFVACLDWNSRKVRVYRGFIDDAAQADLKLMREEARDFLDRIDAREPPDVDWRPATLAALKTLHPLSGDDEDVFVGSQLAARYRAAVRNEKHWERRKKLYEARLRQEMGSARRAWSGGEVIARRDVYPVREHVRKASTVDKIVPVYPKDKKHVSPDHQ